MGREHGLPPFVSDSVPRLIWREAGRGTFVIDQAPPTEALRVDGSPEDPVSMGTRTSLRLLELSVIRATPNQAQQLPILVGLKFGAGSLGPTGHSDSYHGRHWRGVGRRS